MKECPLSGHRVGEDGRCTSHTCVGYSQPERMQEHANWLAKEKGVYLEGWTRRQDPEKPGHAKARQPETGREVN